MLAAVLLIGLYSGLCYASNSTVIFIQGTPIERAEGFSSLGGILVGVSLLMEFYWKTESSHELVEASAKKNVLHYCKDYDLMIRLRMDWELGSCWLP